MKRLLFFIALTFGILTASAQKFCYVDTKYILGEVPEYNIALDQINELSEQWQKDIEEEQKEIDKLFKLYQSEQALLTDKMRTAREEEIIRRERELKELKRKYFGPNGKLFEKQAVLLKPIQEKVQNAIVQYASKYRYAMVFDKAGELVVLYSDPKYDKSDEILKILGY
jgi:outer membrane protein